MSEFTAMPETRDWLDGLNCRTRNTRWEGKNFLSYQEHKDGRDDLTAMPGIGEALLSHQEHKEGRKDSTTVPGWQGRPYCHARNTRTVDEIFCHARNTRRVGKTLLPCQEHRTGRETLLSYLVHKEGREDLTAMPGTQER
jgi:hypothetical protein